jgi:hypothetical protein
LTETLVADRGAARFCEVLESFCAVGGMFEKFVGA